MYISTCTFVTKEWSASDLPFEPGNLVLSDSQKDMQQYVSWKLVF